MTIDEGFSGVPESLRPQLDHNRTEWYRLQRRKRQALIVGVLTGVPIVFAPPDLVPALVITLLVILFVVFGYFEFRRVLVFRRDILERKQQDDSSAAVEFSNGE